MTQEKNQPAKNAGSEPRPEEATAPGAAPGAAAAPAPTPGAAAGTAAEAASTQARRRSRRSTAAPATLRRAAELVQSAPSIPATAGTRAKAASASSPAREHPPAGPDRTDGGAGETPAPAGQSSTDQPSAAQPRGGKGSGKGVLPLLSGEDDPRAWGDRPEDTADWLREQRPPHWG